MEGLPADMLQSVVAPLGKVAAVLPARGNSADLPSSRVKYSLTPTENQTQQHIEKHRDRSGALESLRAEVASDHISFTSLPSRTMGRMHGERKLPTDSIDECAARNFERLRKLGRIEDATQGDQIDRLVNQFLNTRDDPENSSIVRVSASALEPPPSPTWALDSSSWKARHTREVSSIDGPDLDSGADAKFVLSPSMT